MSANLPPAPPPPPPGAYPPAGAGLPPGAPSGELAGWPLRVLAYIIDYIPVAILQGIGVALGFPKTTTTVTSDGLNQISTTSGFGAWYFIFWLLSIIYLLWNRVFKMGTTGQSIGMGVMKTKAVDEKTGQVLGVGKNFLRQLLLIVDFAICYIGVLWPLWDQRKQALLSDKVAGALVFKV